MAKLPMYTQKYQSGGGQTASADSFGAIEGQAKEQFGQSAQNLGATLLGIADRRRNRKDTIERVRAINDFNLAAEKEMTRLSTEGDLTDPEIAGQYNKWLENYKGNILQNHTGTDQSRFELEARLTGMQGTFHSNLNKSVTSAQFKAMGTYLDSTIKSFADMAGDIPESLEAQFQGLDTEISDMSAALTQEQEEAYRTQGRSAIAMSAIDTYLASGDYDAANAVLSHDIVEGALSPDQMRTIKGKIIVAQTEKDNLMKEINAELSAYEQVLGTPMTKAQKQQYMSNKLNMGAPASSLSLPQKIANLEGVLGRPLTETEVQKLGGIHTAGDNLYGGGTRGKAVARANESVSAFASGLMSPEQDNIYVADVIEGYGPIRKIDPMSGEYINMPGTPMPPHVREALERRGRTDVIAMIDGKVDTQTEIPQVQADGGIPMPKEGEPTFYKDLRLTAGPVAAMEGFTETIPGMGAYQDQDITRAKTRISGTVRNVVTALQNNPRYAVSEMEAIQSEINLLPQVFSNPENAVARLIAVDQNLESREETARKTAADRSLPIDVRKQAANVANIVSSLRMRFGLPPQVKTREEAMKYPPGTELILPNGRIGVVPGEGKPNE